MDLVKTKRQFLVENHGCPFKLKLAENVFFFSLLMMIYFLIHLLTLFHKDMWRREKNRDSCDNREGGEDYQTEPEMFVFL